MNKLFVLFAIIFLLFAQVACQEHDYSYGSYGTYGAGGYGGRSLYGSRRFGGGFRRSWRGGYRGGLGGYGRGYGASTIYGARRWAHEEADSE